MLKYYLSGIYNDYIKVVYRNRIIFNGSVQMFIEEDENEYENLIVNLNFDEDKFYPNNIKVYKNKIFLVAKHPEMLNEDYDYELVVFEINEFHKLLDICYFDLQENIEKLVHNDLLKMWIGLFPIKQNYSDADEMKREVFNSILSISEPDIEFDINEMVDNFLSNDEFTLNEISESIQYVSAFIEIGNEVYEWDCFVKQDNTLMFRVDNYYFY